MNKRLFFMLFLVAVVAVTGCRKSVPMYSVGDTPVKSIASKSLSSSDVGNAIKRAGMSLGWRMADVSPGLMEGTLHVRDHVAKIEIPYNSSSYSIKYKDSQNLNYDGQNIHANYNGWIQRLDRQIQLNLSAM